MLDLATNLYQRQAIQEGSLIKLTIARSPIAIRSLLVKFTYDDGEWYGFLREAKENAWIAFSEDINSLNNEIIRDENIYAIQQYNYNQKQRNYKSPALKKKFCKFHEKPGHSTEECFAMQSFKKRGIKITFESKINQLGHQIKNADSKEEDNLIKNDFLYLFSINKFFNYFEISISFIEGNKNTALIDTGAEISLINIKKLPKNAKIRKEEIINNVKSASGNKIEIIGVSTIQFYILGRLHTCEFHVTNVKIDKIILGQDFILNNRNLLINILKDKSKAIIPHKIALSNIQCNTIDSKIE
ncbi:hypothetical protein GVAV_001697 [Gurleya vavrai]